ncbi:MAG: acyl-CoA desaturase [Bacteroidota bacterium]
MLIIISFFLAHWYLSIFSQTFFLHRYAAHRMFKMNKFWERFFYVFTFITQGSSYLSPASYGKMHRLHHAHADTEHDPHSPSYSKNLFDMMWKTRRVYLDIDRDKVEVDQRHTKNLPEWEAFDNFAQSIFTRIAWALFYIWFYVQFAPSAWWFILIPIHITMGPTHGVIINWFSHKIGYRNFESKDTSTNYLPFDFLTMGEGYHNNHHRYGHKPNFGGVRWHEIDLTWLVIRGLDKIGVLQLRIQ